MPNIYIDDTTARLLNESIDSRCEFLLEFLKTSGDAVLLHETIYAYCVDIQILEQFQRLLKKQPLSFTEKAFKFARKYLEDNPSVTPV